MGVFKPYPTSSGKAPVPASVTQAAGIWVSRCQLELYLFGSQDQIIMGSACNISGMVFVPHSFLRNEYHPGVDVSWVENRNVPSWFARGLLEWMNYDCQAMYPSSYIFPMGEWHTTL